MTRQATISLIVVLSAYSIALYAVRGIALGIMSQPRKDPSQGRSTPTQTVAKPPPALI